MVNDEPDIERVHEPARSSSVVWEPWLVGGGWAMVAVAMLLDGLSDRPRRCTPNRGGL